MAKIINFPVAEDIDIEQFIADTVQLAREYKLTSILLAGKSDDGYVVTGYYKCDFGTRQEICGHIQCDIIDQMINAD